MYQLYRPVAIILAISLLAACASSQVSGGRDLDELEVYGGLVEDAVGLIAEGAETEAELLTLLVDLGIALAVRGEAEAAQDAFDIAAGRFDRLSGLQAATVATSLADGYARVELLENAAFYLESGRQAALAVGDGGARSELLADLVLTAARGEGVFADSTRAILDEIILLEDPVSRSSSLLSVATVLSRREVEVDVANLLQQAIAATAEIRSPYTQAGRYATISGLFRRLGDTTSARNAEQKSVTLVLRSQAPIIQIEELSALSTVVAHLRERGLLGDAETIAGRIPLESQRAVELALLAEEAQARDELARSESIAEAAGALVEERSGTAPEYLTARALLARVYRRLGEQERSVSLARRVQTELRGAPATEAFQRPFVELLLYRIAAGEVGRLGEVVSLSESADFRSQVLLTLAGRPELAEEPRLQAGLLRQAAGEQLQELARETQTRLIEELLSRGLINEAVRLINTSPDAYVRAAGFIALLRLAPDYSGPI